MTTDAAVEGLLRQLAPQVLAALVRRHGRWRGQGTERREGTLAGLRMARDLGAR